VPARSRPRSAISGSSAFSTSWRVCRSSAQRSAIVSSSVELIAEQVAEQDRAWTQLPCDRVEPQLVDLEQAELAVDPVVRASGGEQRRRDPASHVRALRVVHDRDPRLLEDSRRHSRRRRLSVRRRDERAAT
jgi:hypothetical protein